MRRSAFQLAVLLTLAIPAGLHGQQGGIVAGRVASEEGGPLPHAQVSIDGTGLGALTDEAGHFRLVGVPVGRSVVRVHAIGFAVAVEEVSVPAGDSVYVAFALPRVRIRIDGAGHPLPARADLVHAERLLPEILGSIRAERALSPRWLSDATVVVWVPWARDPAESVAGFRLQEDCVGCAGSAPPTVEGGRRYSVLAPHLRLGVYSDGPGHLTFCLDPGEPGYVLMANCYGSGQTVVLRYAELADGRWRRVPDDGRFLSQPP